MENQDSEIKFEDGEGYSITPNGLRDLALRQFQKCQELGSKELHPEGTRKVVIDGKSQEIVVPDTLHSFCNAVDILHITLLGKLEDKKEEMEKYMKEYNLQIKEFYDWEKTKSSHIKLLEGNNSPMYAGAFNSFINERDQKYLIAKKKLLMNLSLLMSMLNFFDETGGRA